MWLLILMFLSVCVCLYACVSLYLLPGLQHSPFENSSGIHFIPGRGQCTKPQRGAEEVQGQWRCTASAAQSDRPNAAICNGILSLQLQPCYQWPSKLAAAGLWPAHQYTILPVSSGCWINDHTRLNGLWPWHNKIGSFQWYNQQSVALVWDIIDMFKNNTWWCIHVRLVCKHHIHHYIKII